MTTLKTTLIASLALFSHGAMADNQDAQEKMNTFYSAQNILTMEIIMDESDWLAVKNAEPNGGCSKDYIGSRYSWVEADGLAIESRIDKNNYINDYSYKDIAIKKKSACGSKDSTKPSLNISIDKYNQDNKSRAKDEIGTTHLTLNNSKQDPSILKQCFGYYLFGLAGVPTSRCNFASVYIRTQLGREYLGIYVNVEPVKSAYLKNPDNPFQNADNGYLYEIDEHDLDQSGVIYSGYKGYSDVDDFIRIDYAMSADVIDRGRSVTGIDKSIDRDAFITFWAMEAFVQHWDGYSRNVKNAFAYNDTDMNAVKSSTAGFTLDSSVDFTFIPWGIDQIMQTQSCREIYHCADVSSGLYNNTEGRSEVENKITQLVAEFSAEETTILHYIRLLGTSAQITLGHQTDPLTGATSQTIEESVTYLQNWFQNAIGDGPISTQCCQQNSCSSKSCQPKT